MPGFDETARCAKRQLEEDPAFGRSFHQEEASIAVLSVDLAGPLKEGREVIRDGATL